MSKNVALDRENKRLKLALKQSEYEKQKLKTEIEAQREALDLALRENTVLNETIRLKNNLEQARKVSEEKDTNISDDNDIQFIKETLGQ